MRPKEICSVCILLLLLAGAMPLRAQLIEPRVKQAANPVTPVDAGVSNYLGGGIVLNNFGFGIKGVYGHVLGPFTQITFTTGITGIRYNSQQKVFSFSYFYGTRKSIINKYNRALGFPFMIGVKHRIFPRMVSDNFRFFVAISGGPALALVFPYLNDSDNNGYRSLTPIIGPNGKFITNQFGQVYHRFTEYKEGFFHALGKTSAHWGTAGAIKIGIDFGKKFNGQPTFSFGYYFYYFGSGLQIMDKNKPVFNKHNLVTGSKPFLGKRSISAPRNSLSRSAVGGRVAVYCFSSKDLDEQFG